MLMIARGALPPQAFSWRPLFPLCDFLCVPPIPSLPPSLPGMHARTRHRTAAVHTGTIAASTTMSTALAQLESTAAATARESRRDGGTQSGAGAVLPFKVGSAGGEGLAAALVAAPPSATARTSRRKVAALVAVGALARARSSVGVEGLALDQDQHQD